MSTHTLSVLVENKPGVLAHVAGLFSRRAFNIASLAVGPTHDERVSRITIVVDFRTHDREGVFPMVPAGRPNDEIVLGPEFSADEQRAAARREMGI